MAAYVGDGAGNFMEQSQNGNVDRPGEDSVLITAEKESFPPRMMLMNRNSSEGLPEKKVFLLRRECNTSGHSVPINSPKVVNVLQPRKSLEQREAEYAEARMRIFGSAKPKQESKLEPAKSNNRVSARSEMQSSFNNREGKTPKFILRPPARLDSSNRGNFCR